MEDEQKRYKIAKYVRFLQMLRDELRNVEDENDDDDDDEEYAMQLEEAINHVLDVLEGLGVPASVLESSENYSEDVGERIPKGRILKFADTPRVAFYETKGEMAPTGLQKWASLEEIQRHRGEMKRALNEAKRNPQWLKGGMRNY